MGVLTHNEDDPREEQMRQQKHMQNLGRPSESDVDPDYLDRITDTELDQGTVDILENMLSRDWVLGKFNDAEVHEIRWLARVMVMQLEALHPPENSIWQGEVRRYASDDDRQALTPLDSAQRLVIFELIQGTIARATRSKGGWQQDTLRKQITQSITGEIGEEDDGGWL